MTPRPAARCSSVARLGVLIAACASLACRGSPPALDSAVGATPRPAVKVADWPPLATSPAEPAVTIEAALGSAEGAQIRMRGYLVALSPACPRCNVVGPGLRAASREQDRIGRTARPGGESFLPGCAPCPPAAATFSDEALGGSQSTVSSKLRAVGAAEGLQPRHLGHVFVLSGTFHARADQGAELDVNDVRAIEGP